MNIDIKEIAASAIPHALNICQSYLPEGKLAGREYQCSNLTGGKGDSCKVNITTGKWSDFATDEQGGDLVSLVAAVKHCSQLEAAKELANFIGHTSAMPAPVKPVKQAVWTPILPVPEDAPEPPVTHYKHGKPANIYRYTDKAGKVLQYVFRFEFPSAEAGKKDKKEFFPVAYCRNSDTGKCEWRFQALPDNRPLYGLEQITDTARCALLTEGEKAADAARRKVGHKMPVLTWSCGCGGIDKTDWYPLKGLAVCIWPDNDKPGFKAALSVADAVMKAGAASVKITPPLENVADGYDAADADADGWTAEQVMQHLKSSIEPDGFRALCIDKGLLEPLQAIIDDGAISEHGEQWPEPLMFGEIETPEIKPDLLPEPLATFCAAVTGSCQTPPGMAVMMALSAVATCLQKRFEVAPFGDGYTEPVNIMTATALDPASRKSAVVKAVTEPLTAWEAQQSDLLKDQAAKIRHERDMVIKSIESIKSSASKASATDDDRRDALTEIKRLEDSLPPEVIVPRLWVDDVTVERLQNLMADNGERIALISAEGGIFEVLAGLYSGGKSNINVVLQSHAGEPVRVERQGRSVMMHKPAMTFGLCVQPSIISDLASGNKARFRGNGMLARLLYCIPKSTVGCRNVAQHKPVPENVRAAYHHLIYKLLAIQPVSDEQGRERARMLTLAPDALQSWLAFAQYIESNQGQYGEFNNIQDWTGKLPGAALRIAGLCHVVQHGEQTSVISKPTIEKALDLAELLITHAKAAFELMGTDAAIPDAKFVLQWIIKNGADSFRRNELHKALHGKFHRVDRLKAALQVLTERNIISEPQERPTGKRPEIIHTVNPAVLSGGHYGMA